MFDSTIHQKFIQITDTLYRASHYKPKVQIIALIKKNFIKILMNDPLINSSQKLETQFREVDELFKRIFDPESFSILRGIELIKDFGGITSVMSLLQMSHREGLSSFADNRKRIQVFGENVSPKGENILRKAIATERDFTINLLLYIITLRFFIKLLFIRDGIPVESLWDQIVSFVLLIIMIFLKAMVNLEFLKLDQNEKKYNDEKWIKVRRDGQLMQTLEKCLMVGDIVIFGPDDVVKVDGFVLVSNEFYVSESQTILKQQTKNKYSILNLKQNQNNQNFDPFILSGSFVMYGTAEVLVCRIGQECSFRLKNEKYEQFSTEVTPLIHNLKKMLNSVERISNIIAFLASGYFALHYLKAAILENSLSWFTFLHVLKKFSSLIGFVCLLQKLKIVRSLQFYLQSFRSDKFFKIKNKCTLEKLNEIDLFIIEKDAIKIHQTQRGYIIPKIGFLSYLNRHFKVKIVTREPKQKIMQEFQIEHESQLGSRSIFYEEVPSESSEIRLNRLKDCLFITDCPKNKLQSDLIPIFQGLEYQIAYIYKFRPYEKVNLEQKNIVTIAFAQETAETPKNYCLENNDEWVRIKNTSIAEDHVKQIMVKSIRFCQLYNVYMVQFFNNILVFFFLSWISIYRTQSIDFYWSLTIIIIARFIFFRIYRLIALDKSEPHYQIISHRRIIKLNIFLFFYYLYVLVILQEKINVVLFFVCNATLRTEILFIKVQRAVSVRNIIKNNFIVFTGLGAYILFKALNNMPIDQDFMLVKYVAGLSFLLMVYGFTY